MTDEQPEPAQWTASSRTGAITVRTTDQGLPLGVSLEAAELRRDPYALAADIMRLCRQASNRAALARRAEFEQAGVAEEMINLMGLPTPEEVARQEALEEQDESEPQSWLRQV
ncbi:hypothetical protein ACWEO2_42830 [Nocardia sp. NPDC004278]|uniref:hypothetical protein n=1 Tax=unclassified Nocardia TaxID=2637762 RepID=UPI0033B8C478